LQWLLNPRHINGYNVNNIRHETGTLRNINIEYLKNNEFDTSSKNKNMTYLQTQIHF